MTDFSNENLQGAPTLNALGQYIKDLSFENPNAPQSLGPQDANSNINISVNVNARPLGDDTFEVELVLSGQAGEAGNTIFRFDLKYAGLFRIQNVPAETIQAVVMIECPRLLFPFARQIVADCVRNGGFPPLFIDPIDFAGLFQQRMQAQAANGMPN
jgi:preprotein translocase subunit SecB